MSRADLHTLTGAYALHALAHEEETRFVAHLATCAACDLEVAEFEATTARLATAVAESPPPTLRPAVLAVVASTRQQRPPSRLAGLSPEAWPGWLRSPAGVAAALLLVVALGLGGLAWSQHQDAQQAQALARDITAVVSDPDQRTVSAPLPGGGTGTVVSAHGRAVFLASGTAAPPKGKVYQLWLIEPQVIRSAGLVPTRDGAAQAYVPALGKTAKIALSVEPAGGSRQPTTTPVFVVDVPA